MPCPHCQSSNLTNWSLSPLFYRCNECSLIYQASIPTEAELERFYSSYLQDVHQNSAELNRQRDTAYKLDIDFIYSTLRSHAINSHSIDSVFDYGASGGYFLDSFPSNLIKKGWDFGHQSQQILASKDYFHDLYSDSCHCDLLLLRGVVEHMRNPWIELDSILSSISPKYILISATPNGSSIAASIFKERWHMHLPTEHIYHFSPHHLVDIFSSSGYHLLNLSYSYLDSPYANFVYDTSQIQAALKKDKSSASVPYFDSMFTMIFAANDSYEVN